MATAIEYALMAGASYISTRDDVNQFPIPQGWAKVVNPDSYFRDPVSGFEAISFTNGTEIVISYAGTGPGWGDWIHGNTPLALGSLSDQLRQAADYYLQVKASAPAGATISFTGHSLGGGLASLMAVLFGESAFTFDQAPFLNSAKTTIIADPITGSFVPRSAAIDLRTYLEGRASPDLLAPLEAFIAASDPFNPNPIAADTLAAREARVTDINVQGEILSYLPFSRIGIQADIPQQNNMLIPQVDLHSQALLTAFLQSNQTAAPSKGLNDVTFKLTDLLKMIFDDKLYYNEPNNITPDAPVNLLEHLVRHEAGVRDPATGATTIVADSMITRFTADLWKLAQDGGLTMNDGNSNWISSGTNYVSKTLTAFAMQKYYEETTTSPGYEKELFSAITGGIQFDMADVSDKFNDAFTNNEKLDLNDAKGYKLYFDGVEGLDYIHSLPLEERTLIQSLLPYLRDWYIQAGSSGMTATDTLNRGAFMLGGNRADALVGGTGADLLVGNAGADVLNGGGGNDTLLGCTGNDTLKGGEGVDMLLGGSDSDTYAFTGSYGTDIITDSDGSGTIQVDGQTLGAATQAFESIYKDAATGHTFVKLNGGNSLVLLKENNPNRILVNDWSEARNLGVSLQSNIPAAPTATFTGDFKKKIDGQGTYVMTGGNYTADGDEANAPGLISGTDGNDVIDGKGRDDALSGMAANDESANVRRVAA